MLPIKAAKSKARIFTVSMAALVRSPRWFTFGRVKSLGFPIYMSESPARLASLAPCVGQHTLDVLHGLLGYPVETIHELGACGVVA